jgi:nicotinamidase-related amidase
LPPGRSSDALLILDMISDFRFQDGRRLLRAARRIAPRIRRLKERARAAGLATIYVNDNLGRWRSDLPTIIRQCTAPRALGRDVVELLAPGPRDTFILKPRHSAFYATPLEVLLDHFGTRRLILTGVSSHQCVLFTATDAHVRSLDLAVPRDCIAGPAPTDTRFAVTYFQSVLNADVRPARLLPLRTKARLARGAPRPGAAVSRLI